MKKNNENELTCFEVLENYKIDCSKKECRYWIEHRKSQNCTLIAANDGPKTLQEIGDIFGVTRMRICQIEKTIKSKLEILENKI